VKATLVAVLLLGGAATAFATNNNQALIVQAFDAGETDGFPSPPDTAIYKAFWNDPYLFYELLNTAQYGHRFSLSPMPHDRIHLLYADGVDYPGLTDRYWPYERLDTTSITDASATLDTVELYLDAFANGNSGLGITALSSSDTLVVYLFGHGGHDYHPQGRVPDASKAGHFCLYVRPPQGSTYTPLWDTTFGRLMAAIPAQKIVILQQCYSGGFIDDIADSLTTVITASTSSIAGGRSGDCATRQRVPRSTPSLFSSSSRRAS
jgi:hypothetical protein